MCQIRSSQTKEIPVVQENVHNNVKNSQTKNNANPTKENIIKVKEVEVEIYVNNPSNPNKCHSKNDGIVQNTQIKPKDESKDQKPNQNTFEKWMTSRPTSAPVPVPAYRSPKRYL